MLGPVGWSAGVLLDVVVRKWNTCLLASLVGRCPLFVRSLPNTLTAGSSPNPPGCATSRWHCGLFCSLVTSRARSVGSSVARSLGRWVVCMLVGRLISSLACCSGSRTLDLLMFAPSSRFVCWLLGWVLPHWPAGPAEGGMQKRKAKCTDNQQQLSTCRMYFFRDVSGKPPWFVVAIAPVSRCRR